jgi:enamine deaminase RidA (YjgF/YER057c/UK114 family)
MNDYRTVDAGRPWAGRISYSRAVRRGAVVEVAGTSATSPAGEVVSPGDPYAQAVYILDEIRSALGELGADLTDVVRTRAYLTSIDDWQDVGRAHGEAFGATAPASTFVEISRLMAPGLVVEFEATAIVSNAGS